MGKELTNKCVCVCVYSSPVGVCGAAVLVDGPAWKVYMSVFAAGADNHISACVPTVRYSWIAKGEKNWVIVFFNLPAKYLSH